MPCSVGGEKIPAPVPLASCERPAKRRRLRGRTRQLNKALRLAERTERICAQSAETTKLSRFASERARTLINLSDYRRAAGDSAGALRDARAAVTIWRRLAESAPAQFKPELASGIHMFAVRHAENKDGAAASETRAQALAVYRSLADVDPVAFGPRVAENLFAMIGETADPYDALVGAKEAIDILRRYAPESFNAEQNLPWALAQKAHVLQTLGVATSAIAALREAVEIDEQLLPGNPTGRVHSLVRNLLQLARASRDAGASHEAMIAITRAELLSFEFPDHLSIAQIAEIEEFDCATLPAVANAVRYTVNS